MDIAKYCFANFPSLLQNVTPPMQPERYPIFSFSEKRSSEVLHLSPHCTSLSLSSTSRGLTADDLSTERADIDQEEDGGASPPPDGYDSDLDDFVVMDT